MEQTIKVTKAGYQKMQDRLAFLREVERANVAEEIKVARGFGDLSENAEYDAAKKRQGEVESEIAELEAKIANAKIINASEVEFCEIVDGKETAPKSYKIVGTVEADLSKGKISDESPVGKAISSADEGDTVEVKLPSGRIKTLKILNIKLAEEEPTNE